MRSAMIKINVGPSQQPHGADPVPRFMSDNERQPEQGRDLVRGPKQ
jgi:hypothetical protein